MMKERTSADKKTKPGKLIGRAVSAAKSMAKSAGEMIGKKPRAKSASGSTAGTTSTSIKTPAKRASGSRSIKGNGNGSAKTQGDKLASAVNAVSSPVRKGAAKSSSAVASKTSKPKSTVAANGRGMKAATASAQPAKATKSPTKSAAKSAAKPATGSASKSIAMPAKSSAKPASKPTGKSAASTAASGKTTGKRKLDGIDSAAGGIAIAKANIGAGANNSKPAAAKGSTSKASTSKSTTAKSDGKQAKSAKPARKTAGAAPVKDMPAEAPKGSSVRAMPRSGRGAGGGMLEPGARGR